MEDICSPKIVLVIMQTYTTSPETLSIVNEDIEVAYVQTSPHQRMDLSRAITEDELMTRMQTRLRGMFA